MGVRVNNGKPPRAFTRRRQVEAFWDAFWNSTAWFGYACRGYFIKLRTWYLSTLLYLYYTLIGFACLNYYYLWALGILVVLRSSCQSFHIWSNADSTMGGSSVFNTLGVFLPNNEIQRCKLFFYICIGHLHCSKGWHIFGHHLSLVVEEATSC